VVARLALHVCGDDSGRALASSRPKPKVCE
jgi:hypothetical protein